LISISLFLFFHFGARSRRAATISSNASRVGFGVFAICSPELATFHVKRFPENPSSTAAFPATSEKNDCHCTWPLAPLASIEPLAGTAPANGGRP
jgi:hypothetical protein